jgi:hypothetical protein
VSITNLPLQQSIRKRACANATWRPQQYSHSMLRSGLPSAPTLPLIGGTTARSRWQLFDHVTNLAEWRCGVRALQQEIRTVPIVFAQVSDPARGAFVTNQSS